MGTETCSGSIAYGSANVATSTINDRQIYSCPYYGYNIALRQEAPCGEGPENEAILEYFNLIRWPLQCVIFGPGKSQIGSYIVLFDIRRPTYKCAREKSHIGARAKGSEYPGTPKSSFAGARICRLCLCSAYQHKQGQ
jgi:hypothetical protein